MRFPVVILALSALAADPKPNFSGTWKLAVAKSDFGSAPAPRSMVSQIDHNEPEIRVRSTVAGPQGDYSTGYRYFTDGRENSNSIRGNEIKSYAKWEGASLKVAARAAGEGVQVEFADQWTISADRKTLTMIRVISAPQGKVQQRYVYEK